MGAKAKVIAKIQLDGFIHCRCPAAFEIIVDVSEGEWNFKWVLWKCEFFEYYEENGCWMISKESVFDYRDKSDDEIEHFLNTTFKSCADQCKYKKEGTKVNKGLWGNDYPNVYLKFHSDKKRKEFIAKIRFFLDGNRPLEQPKLIR